MEWSIPHYKSNSTRGWALADAAKAQPWILPSHLTACLGLLFTPYHKKPGTPRPSLFTWTLTCLQFYTLPNMDHPPTPHNLYNLDLLSHPVPPAKCLHHRNPSLQKFASPSYSKQNLAVPQQPNLVVTIFSEFNNTRPYNFLKSS